MTVYVKAKSKAEINRSLKDDIAVFGREYNMGHITVHDLKDLNNGAVVKVFQKYINGSPFAKAYGNMKNGKLV